MKVKLVKINTFHEEYYGDDYNNEVTRHFVKDFSDFEEVNDKEYSKLFVWVKEFNQKSAGKDNKEYYILINEASFPVNLAIKEQIEIEDKRQKEFKEKKRLEKIQIEKEEKERLEKLNMSKKEKLEKKLAKIQKQLEEENKKK